MEKGHTTIYGHHSLYRHSHIPRKNKNTRCGVYCHMIDRGCNMPNTNIFAQSLWIVILPLQEPRLTTLQEAQGMAIMGMLSKLAVTDHNHSPKYLCWNQSVQAPQVTLVLLRQYQAKFLIWSVLTKRLFQQGSLKQGFEVRQKQVMYPKSWILPTIPLCFNQGELW